MAFKENDIRPSDLMEKKKPALEHDKRYLRDRIPLFHKVNCVACNSDNYTLWAEKDGFTYDECTVCGTVFMNPRASEDLLSEFYRQSKNYEFWNKYIFPATDSVRKEKIFKPRASKTIEFCKKYGICGGIIIEIGSAYGTFCEAIQDLKFFNRIIAVEPTPDLAETCRKKGFETLEQVVEELSFEKESADVIANFEVIEHLANPRKFIEQVVSYLKKGGLFICTCPNGQGLGTLVLKEKAKVVDHEHVNYFNPRSLSVLLKSYGLETLEVLTPGDLDVDLLNSEYKVDKNLFRNQPFFSYILQNASTQTLNEFQSFLRKNLLSSHLWIVAKKS